MTTSEKPPSTLERQAQANPAPMSLWWSIIPFVFLICFFVCELLHRFAPSPSVVVSCGETCGGNDPHPATPELAPPFSWAPSRQWTKIDADPASTFRTEALIVDKTSQLSVTSGNVDVTGHATTPSGDVNLHDGTTGTTSSLDLARVRDTGATFSPPGTSTVTERGVSVILAATCTTCGPGGEGHSNLLPDAVYGEVTNPQVNEIESGVHGKAAPGGFRYAVYADGDSYTSNNAYMDSIIADATHTSSGSLTCTAAGNVDLEAGGGLSAVLRTSTGNFEMGEQIDMQSHKVIDVTDPTNPQDAATKNYVDTHTSSSITGSLTSGLVPVATGAHAIGDSEISNDTGAHTVGFGNPVTTPQCTVNTTTGALSCNGNFTINTNKFSVTASNGNFSAAGTGSISGALNMNSNLIDNVTDPVAAQDAMTKHYADAHYVLQSGTSSIVATDSAWSTNINLSTNGTVDWLYLPTVAIAPIGVVAANHNKIGGGWLQSTFKWLGQGSGGVSGTCQTMTANTADDAGIQAGALSTNVCVGVTVVSIGAGMQVIVPVRSTALVLRCYTTAGSSNAFTVTGIMSDGSATGTHNASGTGQREYDITYSSTTPGLTMAVTIISTAHGPGTPDFYVQACTLGT